MSANVPVSVSSASVCCAPPGLNGQAWLQPMHTVVGNYAIAAPSLLLFFYCYLLIGGTGESFYSEDEDDVLYLPPAR